MFIKKNGAGDDGATGSGIAVLSVISKVASDQSRSSRIHDYAVDEKKLDRKILPSKKT
jgi:hypothetical protein